MNHNKDSGIPKVELITLSCNECGAPLEVPTKTKFLNCRFCGSRLAVAHSGGATYTETLEALNQKTDLLAYEIEILRLEREIERLDRDWDVESRLHMIKDKNGHAQIPTKGGAFTIVSVFLVFGLVLVIYSFMLDESVIFALFGMVVIVTGSFMGYTHHTKATFYQLAHTNYLNTRFDVVNKLNALRASANSESQPPHDES